MFGYLTLATALIISLSAAVYSILGLTAIFAAAFWPIVIMGGSLEVGKIVTTLWLHKYWNKAELQYKVYLCSAVAILMLLTSMGVFGFLSKAHTDQSLVSGDVTSKIAIYDEKIKIARDNIDANRRALKQMDEAVDQVMGRSTTEQGADKAVAIRRSQGRERTRLLKEIEAEQKKITALNDERAPIAAEVRKVDAEVGPIKYIAALIYGDNPEANVLEKSVRWVIILIVVVFDPLALTLLLAATKTFEWERGIDVFNIKKRKEEDDDESRQILHKGVTGSDPSAGQPLSASEDISTLDPINSKKTNWGGFGMPFGTLFQKKEKPDNENPNEDESIEQSLVNDADQESSKLAERLWKIQHPESTLKEQRRLLQIGKINNLPWDDPDFKSQISEATKLEADNVLKGRGVVTGFGIAFPENPQKSDMFLRVDRFPTQLYKFNGTNWIEVDKEHSDSYAYDDAYIDHLIAKIDSGEYDPDLLNDAERDRITERLK